MPGAPPGEAASSACLEPEALAVPLEELFGINDAGTVESSEDAALPRPRATLDFEDRREERRQAGLIKWRLEQGVPDVGGLGWRSRKGHLLKNQTFFSSAPKENLWDNPTHAGPKTWKEYHGPRLRCDAPLMNKLDRLEHEQREWEAKKQYVNAVRIQTLDRFYNQKVENQQKEMASQWAPHRRAKREVHQALNCFEAELDSMPVKELQKVLTATVLKGDRDAIRMITKRVQAEETWKQAWKEMERERHDDIRATHEQRKAYNDMLMELAGVPVRPQQIERGLPDSTTPRLRELAHPSGPRHAAPSNIGVTQLQDYKGLVHVDHKHALEAMLPGKGHQLAASFAERASESAQPGWPPPPPPKTPRLSEERSLEMGSLHRASVPASASRLPPGLPRLYSEEALAEHATQQFLPGMAPPPPDQRRQLLQEPIVNNSLHMTQDLSLRTNHTSRDRMQGPADQMDLAPPVRTTTYPVVVPTVEAAMERPRWRPKRAASAAAAAVLTPRSLEKHERWPPQGSRALAVRILRASGLPRGCPDLQVLCQLVGKAASLVRTKVPGEIKSYVTPEAVLVPGWKEGDRLSLTLLRPGSSREPLAYGELPRAGLSPQGFRGALQLTVSSKSEAGGRQIGTGVVTLELDIFVQEPANVDGPRRGDALREFSMPNAEPTVRAVCDHLDDFEAKLVPVPVHGNFWMTPRGDGTPKRGARAPGASTSGGAG